MTSNIANQYLGLLKAGSDQQKYKHSNKEGGVFEELLGKEMDVTYKKATCPETQLDRKEEGSFTYFENDIRKERKIDIELNNGVRLNIESISAIPVCIKTAPKTNKNVFLRAIQKYLSS